MNKNKIVYRDAKESDIDSIAQLEIKVWGPNGASKENITNRIKTFSKGNIIAEIGNRIVGYVATVIINQKKADQSNTWYDYTDHGNAVQVFDPKGDLLFGINLTVDNEIRNLGIGSRLLLQVARIAIENKLKAGILGGRIPFYYTKKDMPVEEYVSLKDEKGRIFDPELRLYSRIGLKIVKLQKGYFKDPDSLDYGVILRWNNPFYRISKLFPFLAKLLSYLFRL